MKAVFAWAGAVLGVVVCASGVRADPYDCYSRTAPDACGPGYYVTNQYGGTYGPCYDLYPPFPPVSGLPPMGRQAPRGCPPGMAGAAAGMAGPGYPAGMAGAGCLPGMAGAGCPGMMPGPQGPSGIAAFPSHPFARGPRDFFMQD